MGQKEHQLIMESESIFGEAPKPGFDCDDGLIGLDGKFKKFYQPDMCYPMRHDAIMKDEKMHGTPSRTLFDRIIRECYNNKEDNYNG